MSYTISQKLNHVNENSYDDDITVTDIPKGQFIAVTAINLPEGSSTREIKVTLLHLEQSEGGTQTINSGLYLKGPDETAVKATLVDDGGKELATNTQQYS